MPQSLTMVYLHITFSTKYRQPYLQDKGIREKVYAYMAGICKNLNAPALIINGVDEHVHLLSRFSKTLTIANYLKEIKRNSSAWIKEQWPDLKRFHWQLGYGAFSISPTHVDAVRQYIANQEQHHQKRTFQDEFRRLCKRYGVEIDERYVWD